MRKRFSIVGMSGKMFFFVLLVVSNLCPMGAQVCSRCAQVCSRGVLGCARFRVGCVLKVCSMCGELAKSSNFLGALQLSCVEFAKK